MVDYATFTSFSTTSVRQDDFTKIEAKASSFLSLLCKDKWDPEDTTCIQAVCYQIEYIVESGGLTEWSKVKGVASSRSYTVGGESESISFKESRDYEGGHYYMGLSVSPFAWALLLNGGFIQSIKGVRVW